MEDWLRNIGRWPAVKLAECPNNCLLGFLTLETLIKLDKLFFFDRFQLGFWFRLWCRRRLRYRCRCRIFESVHRFGYSVSQAQVVAQIITSFIGFVTQELVEIGAVSRFWFKAEIERQIVETDFELSGMLRPGPQFHQIGEKRGQVAAFNETWCHRDLVQPGAPN